MHHSHQLFFFLLAELALCGECLDLSFVLSYINFLPEIEETKFVIQVSEIVSYVDDGC
jgi:hypothetical protein